MIEYKLNSTLNLNESIFHENKLLSNNDFIDTREINIGMSYEEVLDSESRKDESINLNVPLSNASESSKAINKAKNRYGDK